MNSQRPLIFFVSPSWKRPLQHTPLLNHLWGNSYDPVKTPFQYQLFERHSFDQAYYAVTDDIESADMILMPYSHNTALKFFPELIEMCAEASEQSGKPLLIDGIGDVENKISIPNTIVFRYGGYRFKRLPNEIHIPPYADDLLEIYNGGQLILREKPVKPSISFAGWASLTPMQEIRATLKELPERVISLFDSRYGAMKKGVFFRRDAIKILQKSSIVTPNFLVRHGYSGHKDTAEKSQEVLRREFIENLLGSDYALDIRGDANASTRLFELLSLGRIPIIVDTERNLPFSDKLDYSEFSIMVDFRELTKLPEIVAAFNDSISKEKYVEMQNKAREAYLNYFRVDALSSHLIEAIQKKLPK